MLFTTPTQYIALAVALIAGWLFGLASHPGGGKWKGRYVTERDAHAATRRELQDRNAELERENARLVREMPVAPVTERVVERPVAVDPVVERPVGDPAVRPVARATPAYPDERPPLGR
jgi:hypothetical protein